MRRILVTAGASGIGKEIAAAFLSAGDSVYTCDIDRSALDAAARELPGLKTGICDVGDRQQIQAMMADAVSQLGGIDILINNASSPARRHRCSMSIRTSGKPSSRSI